MTPIQDAIVRRGFGARVAFPAGVVLGATFLALIAYNNFWRLGMPSLTRIAGHVFFVLFLAGVFFGALFAYPIAFFRGAGVAERIGACLVTPLAYIASEVIRVTEFFTLGESLYYGLAPSSQLIVLANLGLMGVAEMICRRRLRRRGLDVRIVSIAPVGAVLLFLTGVYVIFLWGSGVHYFYLYMEGYKALFR